MGSLPPAIEYACTGCGEPIDMLDAFAAGPRIAPANRLRLCVPCLGATLYGKIVPERWTDLRDRLAWHAQSRLRLGFLVGPGIGLTTIGCWPIPGDIWLPPRRAKDEWTRDFTVTSLVIELTGEPPEDAPFPWATIKERIFAFVLVEAQRAGVGPRLRGIYAQAPGGEPSGVTTVDEHLATRPDELSRLAQGHELFRQFPRGSLGRGPGSYSTRQDFDAALDQAVASLR